MYTDVGSSVDITGLFPDTQYYYAIYSYNSATNCYYVTGVTGNFTTAACHPTTQASNLTITCPQHNDMTLKFDRGNGTHVIVLARSGSAVNADPVYNQSYTANAQFGSGSQIGTGNYVVYNGNDAVNISVAITGLATGTTYHFKIYEYNASPNCYNYISPPTISLATRNSGTYTSSTTTQITTTVKQNTLAQQVISLNIVIGGGTDPAAKLNSITFNTNGSSGIIADNIINARIFYTGTSSTFSSATQFGSTFTSFSGNLTATGNFALLPGTNYFWIAYDMNLNATVGNVIDATIVSFNLTDFSGTSDKTPSVTAPAGSRSIVTPAPSGYCIPSPCVEAVGDYTSAPTWSGGDLVDPHTYGGGNNSGSGVIDKTAQPAPILTPGITYNLNYYADDFIGNTNSVWIDWDQSGTWSSSGVELVRYDGNSFTVNQSVTVPVGATPGATRMRIINRFPSAGSNACVTSNGSSTSGVYVDYTVIVAGSTGGEQAVSCGTLPPSVTTPVVYTQGDAASPLSASGTGLLWYTAATGGTGSATAPTPSTATLGTVCYYVSSTDGCESPRTQIAVNITPNSTNTSISVNPENQSKSPGENTSFSITASGSNLTYQWQLSTDGGNNYTDITSAGTDPVYSNWTSSTLDLTGIVALNDGYKYKCKVRGDCGGTLISSEGTLTISGCQAVNITEHPQSQTKCEQESVTFTVTVTGEEPITYQWRKGGSDINGATNSSYTINSLTKNNAGNYTCYLTNCAGLITKTSDIAVLTVNELAEINFPPVNASVKDGGTTSFSIAASGTDLIYEWQMNDGSGWSTINNGGSNPEYSGATSNKLIITDVTLSMNSYTYRCIVSNSCATILTSSSALLTVRQDAIDGLWIGVTSTAWQTGSNWDTGFEPTAGTNVTIPLSAINKPEISAGITGVCANLTIMPRASLIVRENGTLNVSGNFSIESDITGTGALLTEDNATITVTGKSIFKQYIAKLGYHYITSVIDGSSLAQINDDMPLKNLNGLYYNIDNPPPQNLLPNVWKYDEPASAADPDNNSYQGAWLAPNGLEPMPYIKGYALVMNTEPVTIDMQGDNYKFYNGDLSYNLTKGGNGYNITGNPYPSPIDWDLIAPTLPAGVNRGITFFYGTSLYYGGFGTYHPLTGPGGAYPHEQYIPSMQAFYLKVSNPATITLKNSHRTVAPEALGVEFYKKKLNKKIEFPVLKLKAYMADNYNLADEAVIYFNNEATKGFDYKFDVPKMLNTIPELPNIYTSSDKEHLSINGLPAINNNLIIPLYYKVAVTGKYTLQVSDLSNFDVNTNVYLFDILTGQSYILTDKSKLMFNISSTELNQRFYIKFSKSVSGITDNNDKEMVYAYSNNGNIIINYNNSKGETAKMNILTSDGKIIANEIFLSNGTYTYSKNLASGLYFVRITTNKQVYFKKLFVE